MEKYVSLKGQCQLSLFILYKNKISYKSNLVSQE